MATNLVGGRRLHALVATAYGKGAILRFRYEKMSGNFFVLFIRTHFNLALGQANEREQTVYHG